MVVHDGDGEHPCVGACRVVVVVVHPARRVACVGRCPIDDVAIVVVAVVVVDHPSIPVAVVVGGRHPQVFRHEMDDWPLGAVARCCFLDDAPVCSLVVEVV